MSYPVALLQQVKSAGGRFEMRAWLQLHWLHNWSDHGDKQETWTLTMVCEEWESVEVRMRTMQYARTYVMSCGKNPSQNLGASFHWLPGNRDRGARWVSMFGMNESQLRVAVVSLFQAPSWWWCQKRTNGLLRSAPCMSVAVSVTETTSVTSKA